MSNVIYDLCVLIQLFLRAIKVYCTSHYVRLHVVFGGLIRYQRFISQLSGFRLVLVFGFLGVPMKKVNKFESFGRK